jgi:hypothetical protein
VNSLFIARSLPKLDLSPVKWLGKDAIAALAVDGKGTKSELLGKVGQWTAARGRNVTQPGEHQPP